MELSSRVFFEPVGSVTNVFFDDKNQQVFSVRSGGATGIIVRGFSEDLNSTFLTSEDMGPIFTIKLSPDQKILAVQRAKNQVEFFPVLRLGSNGSIDQRNKFLQYSKGKTSTILGFAWTGDAEILFVSESGLELHSVSNLSRGVVKNVRNQAQLISWFMYSPESSFIVCSPTASTTSVLHVFLIKNSYIQKLSKIEFDSKDFFVKERDIFIGEVYGKTYVGVFLQASGGGSSSLHLYSLSSSKDSSLTKSHILKLSHSGPFSTNVVDNLLVVHHQSSGSSFIFDPSLPGESDGTVIHLEPVTNSPIKISTPEGIYPLHWATFQPDLIVDGKVGSVWKLKLKIRPIIIDGITDLKKKIEFLLRREGSKIILLDVMYEKCEEATPDLVSIAGAFDLINWEYKRHTAHKNYSKSTTCNIKVVIDQSDMFTNLFSRLLNPDEQKESILKKRLYILMEYFRSLKEIKIPVQHFFDELLINLMVRLRLWYQLHQLLQYQVITDSKPLSCLLLSLESVYKPAVVLAMDMLKRLGSADSEIAEILLSKSLVLPALKFATSGGESVPARRFLDAALATGINPIFYSTYKFFEERNLILRSSKNFSSSDRCEEYVKKFKELYPQESE